MHFTVLHSQQTQPHTLLPATVYKKGDKLILTGYGEVTNTTKQIKDTLTNYILSAPEENKWCIQWVDIPMDDGIYIMDAIKIDLQSRSATVPTNNPMAQLRSSLKVKHQKTDWLGKLLRLAGPRINRHIEAS
jgi:hypothetical protein